jgi:hypothetical protein
MAHGTQLQRQLGAAPAGPRCSGLLSSSAAQRHVPLELPGDEWAGGCVGKQHTQLASLLCPPTISCCCVQLEHSSSSKLESMSSAATDDKASDGSGSVQEAGIGATTITAAPGEWAPGGQGQGLDSPWAAVDWSCLHAWHAALPAAAVTARLPRQHAAPRAVPRPLVSWTNVNPLACCRLERAVLPPLP